MKILNPSQIKEFENSIINQNILSQEILMENAAHSIFRVIENRFKQFKIIVLCGPGNNGGDGLALARILDSEGYDTTIVITHDPKYSGAALRNFQTSKNIKQVSIKNLTTDNRTIIVDGIFGIGLNKNISQEIEDLIFFVNSSLSKIISIDIPSGVNGETGEVMGKIAINADITVTFLANKTSQFLFPGAKFFGEVILSKLSVPQYLFEKLNGPSINTPLRVENRSLERHKGSSGKILSIAGSSNFYGAPYFCSKAALLTGSGYSVLITDPNVASVCATLAPEVIYKTDSELESLITNSTSLIFGPGLGVSNYSKNLLYRVIKESPPNLVLDADGINLLALDPGLITNLKNMFIMTPHPGELANLLNLTIIEIENNRVYYAKTTAEKLNCIVVLKGVFTVIAAPNGEVFINNTSSATLATAGSGDILCGIIGTLISNMDLISGVRAGVYIHGLMGKLAQEVIGETGVTATDLIKFIPIAIKKYKSLC